MASLTIPTSFLPATRPSSINRRSSASANPSTTICSEKKSVPTRSSNKLEYKEKDTVNSRRGVILAAAAAAVWALRSPPEMMAIAAEEDEPKRGTPEAKKKYYPVCVTMPTARICYK